MAYGICKACGQRLKPDIRRCPACGSFQKWRDALCSVAGLALVLATMSLMVSVLPLIGDALRKGSTSVDASLQGATLGGMSILVNNRGGRATTFVHAILTVEHNGTARTYLNPVTSNPSDVVLIQPETTDLIELEPRFQEGWQFAGSESRCSIEYLFLDDRGQNRRLRRRADCNALMGYVVILGARYRGMVERVVEARGGRPLDADHGPIAIDDAAIAAGRLQAADEAPVGAAAAPDA